MDGDTMGSGRSGLYSGTSGSSQPYAPSYHVVKSMHEYDKDDPDIWSGSSGYRKNESAINIGDSVHGSSVVYDGKKANGKMTYVVDTEGNLIFGKRSNPINPDARSPHPMLIGGKDPQVKVAGMIEFRGGKIYDIDAHSGHYRPPAQSLQSAEKALSRLPREVFHRKSSWRKQ